MDGQFHGFAVHGNLLGIRVDLHAAEPDTVADGAQTGLHDVDNVVTGLLAFANEIGEHGTEVVPVHLGVQILDVLLFERVAAGVDTSFDILGVYDGDTLPAVGQGFVHPGQGLVDQGEHLGHASLLLLAEHNLVLALAAQDAGQVEAAVAHGLELADLAEHCADLLLGIVGQMGRSHFAEVAADLVLHLVAHILDLLDTVEELVEGLLILDTVEFLHLAEHAFHPLAEDHDFLLRLQDRDFRGLHDTAANVLQAEFVLFFGLLGLDEEAHQLFNLRNEPDQDGGVDHIETGMERCQREGKLGGVLLGGIRIQAHDAADHPDEREEENEHPDDAEHVEHQVRHSGPSRLRIRAHRGEVRRNRGADVLTHNQRDTLIDGDSSRRAQDHRNGHQRRGTLHHGRQDRTDQQEQQYGAVIGLETREEGDDGRLAGQVHFHTRLLQHSQGKEQEGKAEEEIADVAVLAQLDQDNARKKGRPHHVCHIEGETGRHDPRTHRRTDVRTHDDRNGLGEREQGRVHEGHRHHGGGGGGLDRDGHERTGGNPGETVGGHRAQQVTKLRARHLLEGLAHHFHAVDQEGDRAEKFQDDKHRDIGVLILFDEIGNQLEHRLIAVENGILPVVQRRVVIREGGTLLIFKENARNPALGERIMVAVRRQLAMVQGFEIALFRIDTLHQLEAPLALVAGLAVQDRIVVADHVHIDEVPDHFQRHDRMLRIILRTAEIRVFSGECDEQHVVLGPMLRKIGGQRDEGGGAGGIVIGPGIEHPAAKVAQVVVMGRKHVTAVVAGALHRGDDIETPIVRVELVVNVHGNAPGTAGNLLRQEPDDRLGVHFLTVGLVELQGVVPGKDEAGVRGAVRTLELLEVFPVLVSEPEITDDESVLVLRLRQVVEDFRGIVVEGVDVIDRKGPFHARTELPDGEIRSRDHFPTVDGEFHIPGEGIDVQGEMLAGDRIDTGLAVGLLQVFTGFVRAAAGIAAALEPRGTQILDDLFILRQVLGAPWQHGDSQQDQYQYSFHDYANITILCQTQPA